MTQEQTTLSGVCLYHTKKRRYFVFHSETEELVPCLKWPAKKADYGHVEMPTIFALGTTLKDLSKRYHFDVTDADIQIRNISVLLNIEIKEET